MISISILDQVPVSDGQSPKKALLNSIELAKLADNMGYKRYWIAEHHSCKYLANSTPEILMSSIAAQTENIKVGSGGILLQHYSPYKIAENLKLLDALYPHRIDAGFGRTAGGDSHATQALQGLNSTPYELKIKQTVDFLTKQAINDNELIVSPLTESYPEIWLLGSGMKSAEIAANEGLSFAFGHFLKPDDGEKAIDYYLNNFKPSSAQHKPNVALCINVICADSEEKCEDIATSQDLMTILLDRGLNPNGSPNPNDAKNFVLADKEKELISKSRQELILGTPQKVRKEILRLSRQYKADEILILTITYDHNDRLNSYKLIMEEMKNDIKKNDEVLLSI